MRGRIGVIFQGREFESHRRRVLQLYFQRKRGRVGSKIFAIDITKAALVSWQHSRLQICGSAVRFPPVALLHFLVCPIFSSLFVVRYLTSHGLDHLERLGSIQIHHLFHHLVFYIFREKIASATRFFSMRVMFSNRVIFNTLV